MKEHIKLVLLVLLGLSVAFVGRGQNDIQDARFAALYQRWHQALEAHPGLTEPMLFLTEGMPNDLASAVQEIQQNKSGFAVFLCEKIAGEHETSYFDVLLLHEVAGIELLYADDQPATNQNIRENIAKFAAQFREEWRQGLYKDPSKRVAQLCEEKMAREGSENIDPRDLVAIRRYGIFGLPELIRQIKKQNSKHAFAAFLIISGKPFEYADYIHSSNHQFIEKESKIKTVEGRVNEMKATDKGQAEVMKKVSAALAD